MDKIKSFIKEHFILLLTIIIFLGMWLIGTTIRNSARNDYMAVYNQLSDLKNQIDHDKIGFMQEKTTVVTGLLDGLDKERWRADDVVMTEWLYPAFNFNNADEYNENRDIYVARLGSTNDFVLEIMPPYNASYRSQQNEDAAVDDGSNINMHVANFVSYVDSIADDVYSYVAVVTVTSTNKKGRTNSSDIILTYAINGKGEVRDFRAATPYYPV